MPRASDDLLERVAKIIPPYNMVRAGDRIGVAVSGGADSVTLLHLFERLSARFDVSLLVLHVNHRLRGAESDEDETFVRALSKSLGREVIVVHAPVGEGNLEEEARRARREFFRAAMERHGLRRVALGHTRSDQAETVLFRLLRGSGVAGLAGMRMVTADGLIRPLLTTSREEVREWARSQGIEWREDSSNRDSRFTRNRLRNEAIPLLRDGFNPNLEGVLAGMAQVAADEEDYWGQQVEPIYQRVTKRTRLGSIFQVSQLNELEIAVRRRLIRRALADIRGNLRSIDMEHVEAIARICCGTEGHDRVIVPGVDAIRSFGTLLLARDGEINREPRGYCTDVPDGVECELPFHAGFVRVNPVEQEGLNCGNFKGEQPFSEEIAYLDEDALAGAGGRLAVRNWEPGDALQRSGYKGAEKIKFLFQQHRVLLWERRHWPVAIAGREIVWVRGFGTAERFRASARNGRVVRLEYRPAAE